MNLKSTLWMAPVLALGLTTAAVADHHKGGHGKMSLDANGDGKLSLSEAQAMHMKKFENLDANGDGNITDAEMRQHDEMMQKRMAEKMAQRRQMQFSHLDTNKDGKISQAEFAAPQKARFEKVDANGDNMIDKSERMAARENMKAKWKAKKEAAGQ